MESTRFSPHRRLGLMAQGGLLFGLGLVVGLFFTFVIVGRVEIWPVLPAIDWTVPGTEAAWRRAHLGLMFNAVTLLVFAVIASALSFSVGQQRVYGWSVAITAWGNSAGFLLAALTGTRGLAMGSGVGNSLTYLCFLAAALTAFVQVWLLVAGALRARRELS
ncbi:MAG: hypothetical protein V4650_11510 [Pseudomonadota bacterium]